jgi:putative inorganic carbon (HCO3(-)) transporter
MVKDRPFLGKGLGTFMDYSGRYSYGKYGGYYAHNSYLQIAAESGVFSLFLFLLFLGAIFYKGVKSFLSRDNFILLGLICGVSGFLVHAFFDCHFYSLPLAVLFWFLLGLTCAATKLNVDVDVAK